MSEIESELENELNFQLPARFRARKQISNLHLGGLACSNQAAVGIVRSLSYQPRGRMYCIVCPVCRYTNRLPVPYDTPYVGVMARRVFLRTLRSSRGSPAAGPRPRVSCPRPGSLSRLSSNQPPSNQPHGIFYNVYIFSEHSLSHNIPLLISTSTATKMYIKSIANRTHVIVCRPGTEHYLCVFLVVKGASSQL